MRFGGEKRMAIFGGENGISHPNPQTNLAPKLSKSTSNESLLMTEKIKTIIWWYFLLPRFFYLADTLALRFAILMNISTKLVAILPALMNI